MRGQWGLLNKALECVHCDMAVHKNCSHRAMACLGETGSILNLPAIKTAACFFGELATPGRLQLTGLAYGC